MLRDREITMSKWIDEKPLSILLRIRSTANLYSATPLGEHPPHEKCF